MNNVNINFDREKNGYSKTQVDEYINKLSRAYEAVYNEYLEISIKYDNSMETSNSIMNGDDQELSQEVAKRSRENTEALMQKIIAEALIEASSIMTEAQLMKDEAQAMIDRAEENARRIIDEANAEATAKATQARIDLDDVRLVIEQAQTVVDMILAPHKEDAYIEEYTAA